MNKKFAKNLVTELVKHPIAKSFDKKLFTDILESTDIPVSSRFYEPLQDKKQLIQGTSKYHYLSLRRVLRNQNAKRYKISPLKKAYEAIASTFGIYSSEVLNRNLRTNGDLMEMMAKCEQPYSLLGKFQTYDYDNPDSTLFIVTRPVLVIPGEEDTKVVSDWEEANTIYEKEVGLLLRHPKRIKPKEYLSC